MFVLWLFHVLLSSNSNSWNQTFWIKSSNLWIEYIVLVKSKSLNLWIEYIVLVESKSLNLSNCTCWIEVIKLVKSKSSNFKLIELVELSWFVVNVVFKSNSWNCLSFHVALWFVIVVCSKAVIVCFCHNCFYCSCHEIISSNVLSFMKK